MKSTSSTRDSWARIAVSVAGLDGSRRSRLQSPYGQSGSHERVPE